MANIHAEEKIYFEWDRINVNHINRHDIQPYEVEEAYLEDKNKKVFFDIAHSRESEQRFIVLATAKSSNKFMKVVLCFYKNKIRVITTHKATNDKKLLKIYKN